MQKFGEVRRVHESAKIAGLQRQEQKKIIQNPTAYITELLRSSPAPRGYDRSRSGWGSAPVERNADLAKHLKPEMVTAFLRAASGEKVDQSALIALGNLLHGSVQTKDLGYHRQNELTVTYTDGEKKLLQLGVAFFEQALYRGDLVRLHGPEAGVVAFAANRLAKVTEPLHRNVERASTRDRDDEADDRSLTKNSFEFDRVRFEKFANKVTEFAEQYYSLSHISQEILRFQRQQNDSIAATLGENDVRVIELKDIEKRLNEVSFETDAEKEDETQRALELFNGQTQRLVQLLSNTEAELKAAIGHVLEVNGTFTARMLMACALTGKALNLRSGQRHYDFNRISLSEVIAKLEKQTAERNPFMPDAGSSKKVRLQDLQAKHALDVKRECLRLLQAWQVFRFLPETNAVRQTAELMQQRDRVLTVVKEALPKGGTGEFLDARYLEDEWRKAAMESLEKYTEFKESRDKTVQRNNGLYFLKTVLVASDLLLSDRMDMEPIKVQFLLDFDHSMDHDFNLKQGSRDVLKIHYMPGELPFASMAVLAMRERRPVQKSHQIKEYSLESQSDRFAREFQEGMFQTIRGIENAPDVKTNLRNAVQDFFGMNYALRDATEVVNGLWDDGYVMHSGEGVDEGDELLIEATREMRRLQELVRTRQRALVNIFQEHPEVFPRSFCSIKNFENVKFIHWLEKTFGWKPDSG